MNTTIKSLSEQMQDELEPIIAPADIIDEACQIERPWDHIETEPLIEHTRE